MMKHFKFNNHQEMQINQSRQILQEQIGFGFDTILNGEWM